MGGHEIYIFLSPYPTDDWLSSSWEEDINVNARRKKDEGRWKTDDERRNRSPELLRWHKKPQYNRRLNAPCSFHWRCCNKKHVYPLQTLGDKGIFHFTLFHWFSFRVGLGRRKFRIFVSLYWNIFVRPLQLFHCKTMSVPTLTFDHMKKKKGRLCSRVCRYVCEGKFYCVNYHRELS